MSRLKEQRLWDTLKRHAPRELFLQRVENVMVDGMPDVYAVGSGVWIELKAPTAPKRPTTPLMGDEGLRPAQVNWILQATSAGRLVYVLIRDSQERLWLMPGALAAHMNHMIPEELDNAAMARNWPEIIKRLTDDN